MKYLGFKNCSLCNMKIKILGNWTLLSLRLSLSNMIRKLWNLNELFHCCSTGMNTNFYGRPSWNDTSYGTPRNWYGPQNPYANAGQMPATIQPTPPPPPFPAAGSSAGKRSFGPMKCFICNEEGHRVATCPQNPKNK